MNRSFRLLLGSQAAANIGDVLYIIVIITVLYSKYQSALLLSILPFVITICKFSCGMAAPILFDRYALKKLLVISQLMKIVLLLLLALLLFSDEPILWLIFVLVALISIADGIQQPVSHALVPSITGEEQLLKANSILSLSFQTTDLVSWSLGAVLVAFLGESLAVFLTIGLYGLSLLLIALLSVHSEMPTEKPDIRKSLLEGWQIILANPVLRRLLLMDCMKGIAYTVWLAAILFVFVGEVLSTSGEQWWGYINTSRIIGTMAAAFIAVRLAGLLENRLNALIFPASLSTAVITLLFGLNSWPLAALILVVLIGFPEQAEELVQTTFVQKQVRDIQLAKVYTAQSMVYYLVFAVSSLGAGVLADHFDIRLVFIFAAVFLFFNALIARSLPRLIKE